MNPEITRDKFDVNFYKWSSKEFDEEINNGFQILKTIQNIDVMQFLEMTSNMSAQVKSSAANALLKNHHKNAAKLCEDLLTDEEAEFLKKYFKIGSVSKYSEKIFYRNQGVKQSDPIRGKSIDRKKLLKKVIDSIVPIVGEVKERAGGSIVFLEKRFGDWKVSTNIDVGGRMTNLSYDHYIRNEDNFVLLKGGSLLSRFGLASSSTDWTELLELDSDIAIQTLKLACKKFMDAIPGFINE